MLTTLAEEIACDDTSIAMQQNSSKLEHLHHTATVAVQAASSLRVQLPECLHFLCEFSAVWDQVAKLQEHKAKVLPFGSSDQQAPDLQETIENGVDKAVSRLMPMFDGPAQFWSLLFATVEKLCSICNPAFDRGEVRSAMQFVCTLSHMPTYILLPCSRRLF